MNVTLLEELTGVTSEDLENYKEKGVAINQSDNSIQSNVLSLMFGLLDKTFPCLGWHQIASLCIARVGAT